MPPNNSIAYNSKSLPRKTSSCKNKYNCRVGSSDRIETRSSFEFTKSLWLQDAQNSLRNLLTIKVSTKLFLAFLRSEHSEGPLEFYLDAQSIEDLHHEDQPAGIMRVYNVYFNDENLSTGRQSSLDFKEIGCFDTVISLMRKKINKEAEATLKVLANAAFHRFIDSEYYCKQTLEALRMTGTSMNDSFLLDARGWWHAFVSMAETMPVSVAITDMTYPGAPLVYINQEFTNTTGYSRDEVVGRNCRFLQGPETEPEVIQVIRRSLSTAQNCHVKITNYRKNGEVFQNSLSMRPVFDDDTIYRYVISFQFEIKSKKHRLTIVRLKCFSKRPLQRKE